MLTNTPALLPCPHLATLGQGVELRLSDTFGQQIPFEIELLDS